MYIYIFLTSKKNSTTTFPALKNFNVGRTTDTEAEAPVLWPPDVKSQFIAKDPDTRKD